ncbi:MAG: membrane protein insertion efficiency factor YidD [Rhodospirillaceae bacterium]
MNTSPLSTALRGAIRAYQITVSPLLGPRCRFHPSCSQYACEAITAHGAAKGAVLAAKRLLRCHPWGGSGIDPVPSPPSS